jgi:hypothetical protein
MTAPEEWIYAGGRYDSDGQICSEAGVPVALLMENHDINVAATATATTR